MPKKTEEKIIKETKIPVRIVKTAKPSKKTEKTEKETSLPQKNGRLLEEQRKGLIIAVSVIVIMLIIFSIWITFLKYDLKKSGQEEQSLWGTIKNNLTSGLSGVGKGWEQIKNVFFVNTNQTEEQQLEDNVFPEIKSTNTNQ